jgi:predicted DCC family thiol-disulfide oxidoreductase YuxK
LTASAHHIVFFDGVCGLCDRAVRFLLRHDRRDRLRFAALQGETARRLLPPLGGQVDDLDTMYVLTRDGRLLRRSRAILFAGAALGGGWSLLALLRIIPAPLLDLLYRFVSRVRYRIFGRFDVCQVPTPEDRARFLDQTSPSSTGT